MLIQVSVKECLVEKDFGPANASEFKNLRLMLVRCDVVVTEVAKNTFNRERGISFLEKLSNDAARFKAIQGTTTRWHELIHWCLVGSADYECAIPGVASVVTYLNVLSLEGDKL